MAILVKFCISSATIMLVLSSCVTSVSKISTPLQFILMAILLSVTLLVLSHITNARKVFLVDFACHKPPEDQVCSKESAVNRARIAGYSEDTLKFMTKLMNKVGLGDLSYSAKAIMVAPPNLCLEAAREESEMVIFGAIDKLLAKTKISCSDIRILIVNCTVFNAVPSLSSIIVNHYKLREDIANYNLSGMGCSSGLMAVGLAKHLLQVHRNSCALIVSTENLTSSVYTGKDLSKFLGNCIFRVGGAAILLSNHPAHQKQSKYQLLHTVHTHTASSDLAYRCIFREEDEEGITGVTINKDLLKAAIHAIESNLKSLGPLILPLSEQVLFLKNYIIRHLKLANTNPYIPKFSKCVHHFLPHVGGKPVLDELQKIMGFSDSDMEASVMTLHRFGNTSSSSVWYELAYEEAKGRIKKSNLLWHIAFGSGFKCNSVIWRALRDVEFDDKNPWRGDIDDYPIHMDTTGSLPYHLEPSK